MEFNEIQRFRPWWVWVSLLLVIVFPFSILVYHLLQDPPAAYEVPTDTWLILLSAIPFVLLIIFLSVRLEIRMNESGISYRFFPFHPGFRSIPWSDISEAYIKDSKRLRDGSGIRYSFRSGPAINLTGTTGISIKTRSGKRVLLGTRKPNEVSRVLSFYMEEKARIPEL